MSCQLALDKHDSEHARAPPVQDVQICQLRSALTYRVPNLSGCRGGAGGRDGNVVQILRFPVFLSRGLINLRNVVPIRTLFSSGHCTSLN